MHAFPISESGPRRDWQKQVPLILRFWFLNSILHRNGFLNQMASGPGKQMTDFRVLTGKVPDEYETACCTWE